jgi:hypothetical protein
MIETSKSKAGYLALSVAFGAAMSAGTAYGVDAMYVDAAGNVGIGASRR